MLAPDKIVHLKGGTIVLIAALGLSALGHELGLHWLSILLIVAGLAAGASVEGTQYADNRRSAQLGLPLTHEVSLADLIASAAPCWAAALVLELARHQGVVPSWLG